MSSAREINDRCSQMQQAINNRLNIIISGQIGVPDYETLKKMQNIRMRVTEETKKVSSIYGKISQPHNLAQQDAQRHMQQSIQSQSVRLEQEYASKTPALAQEKQNKLNEINNQAQAQYQDVLQKLQAQYLDIESPELEACEKGLTDLLNEVGVIDRALKNAQLFQNSQRTFAQHEVLFQQAYQVHNLSATRIGWIMFVAMILGAAFLYKFFDIKSLTEQLDRMKSGSNAPYILLGITLISGRLAFLIGWGGILALLADLFKKNQKQAVIYRDRRVALGIAENLLSVTPQLEEKKALLSILSAGYLDFDKNAFHAEQIKRTDIADPTRIAKEAIDTVKPIFESVKGLFEKK